MELEDKKVRTDIGLVERIRNRPNDAPLPTEYLLDEAADAIERWEILFEHNRKAADEQEDEIERLRGALEKIAGGCITMPHHHLEGFPCFRIARAALGREDGK